jgi:putative addiction module component (TIGR02574 family)
LLAPAGDHDVRQPERVAGNMKSNERQIAIATMNGSTSIDRSLAVHRKRLRAQTPEGETDGMRNAEFDFSKLSVADRIQLAEDLWDSIPESADITLTDAQKAELDRRLQDLEQHPDAGEPWEVVRARLYGRLKRGE